MADNIPTAIIRNIPPSLRLPRGNDGTSFILPPAILEYSDSFIALEPPDMMTPAISAVQQEDGSNILIELIK